MVQWRVRGGSRVIYAPAVSNRGTIYAVAADPYLYTDYHLYAVTAAGDVLWRAPMGSTPESLLATGADDVVFVAGHERDYHLRAFDSRGAERWNIDTWTFSNWYKSEQGLPVVSPDGQYVYVGGTDGTVHAVATDGKELWGFNARDDFGPPIQVAVGPTGMIYCAGARLYALQPDGTVLWDQEVDGDPIGRPAVAPDGCIVVGSAAGLLYSFFPDGRLRWRREVGPPVQVGSPAINPDGAIYVGLEDGAVCAFSPDGERRWSLPLDAPLSSGPVVGPQGTIYVGAERLFALTPAGTIAWTFALGISATGAPAVGQDGTVYVGADRLYAIDDAGHLRWTVETVARVAVDSVLVIDSAEHIYVAMEYHAIHAIARDGTVRWTAPLFLQPRHNLSPDCNFDISERVAHDLLILGTDTVCILSDQVALYSSHGDLVWRHVPGGVARAAIASQGPDPTMFAIFWLPDSEDMTLHAWSSEGVERWTRSITVGDYHGPEVAVGRDGTLFVLDGTGTVHALTADGTPLWAFAEATVPFRDLALGPQGQVVLLADYSSHLLYVLDAQGTLQWTCDMGEALRGVAIDPSGTIYATTSGHKLFALNRDGTVRWSRTFQWDAGSGPIIDGQGVVYIAVGKTLFAINNDGTERWSFQASDFILSGPVIGGSGRIYIGTRDGYLWALGSDSVY